MDSLKNKKILIIDDDLTSAKTLTLLFEKLGAQNLTTMDNGVASFELIKEQHKTIPFELIVSDFIMPEITGLDLYKQLILNDINIPFAMVTANSDSESVKEMIDLGISMILVKPITIEMLKNKVVDRF